MGLITAQPGPEADGWRRALRPEAVGGQGSDAHLSGLSLWLT